MALVTIGTDAYSFRRSGSFAAESMAPAEPPRPLPAELWGCVVDTLSAAECRPLRQLNSFFFDTVHARKPEMFAYKVANAFVRGHSDISPRCAQAIASRAHTLKIDGRWLSQPVGYQERESVVLPTAQHTSSRRHFDTELVAHDRLVQLLDWAQNLRKLALSDVVLAPVRAYRRPVAPLCLPSSLNALSVRTSGHLEGRRFFGANDNAGQFGNLLGQIEQALRTNLSALRRVKLAFVHSRRPAAGTADGRSFLPDGVQQLHMIGCLFDEADFARLCATDFSSLQSLRLHNDVALSLTGRFAALLQQPMANLREISAAYCGLTDQHILEIDWSKWPQLQVLRLSGNLIGNAGFAHLVQTCPAKLRQLDVASNPVDATGLRLVEQRPPGCLQDLSIGDIYGVGQNLLRERRQADLFATPAFSAMTSLWLKSNTLTLVSLQQLLNHLAPQLHVFHLYSGLGNRAATQVAQANFRALTTLSLRELDYDLPLQMGGQRSDGHRAWITLEGLDVLLDSRRLSTVRELYLDAADLNYNMLLQVQGSRLTDLQRLSLSKHYAPSLNQFRDMLLQLEEALPGISFSSHW